jgi:dimethylargininase
MNIALTHVVSPEINRCELSFREREPIDLDKARAQHAGYCRMLEDCGYEVVEVDVNSAHPDGTFIEDTAVVVDEVAVLSRPGVESRRGEVAGIEPVLASYRPLERIEHPGTLEGGDVLRIGRTIYVGLSARTNQEGIDQLSRHLSLHEYKVIPVAMKGCLHLKSALTALDDQTLLARPGLFDPQPFAGFTVIPADESEPEAANALRAGNFICLHVGFTKTIERVRHAGFAVKTVDISELLKAESGLTCSSILLED